MSDVSNRIEVLFNLYYEGIATREEIQELMHFIDQAKEDTFLQDLVKQAWDRSHITEGSFTLSDDGENMLKAIFRLESDTSETTDQAEHRSFWSWTKYAAAAMVLVSLGWYAYFLNTPKTENSVAIHTMDGLKKKKTNHFHTTLTLENGMEIALDSKQQGVIAHESGMIISRTADGLIQYEMTKNRSNTRNGGINTLRTPKGAQSQIKLEDGSLITLNAFSQISFPTQFSENERLVEITGEAYFEVAKNPKAPFKVRFGNAEVQVLGTTFNIMAYDDEPASKTTLIEGSVALKTDQFRQIIVPGEQASIFPNGKMTSTHIDVAIATAWKSGFFYFKDANVKDVMRTLSRWYNVDVVYEGPSKARQFTGRITHATNLSELMEILNYAGVKCSLKGRKINVSK